MTQDMGWCLKNLSFPLFIKGSKISNPEKIHNTYYNKFVGCAAILFQSIPNISIICIWTFVNKMSCWRYYNNKIHYLVWVVGVGLDVHDADNAIDYVNVTASRVSTPVFVLNCHKIYILQVHVYVFFPVYR